MTEAALARQVSQLYGWQRTGARIQARVAKRHSSLDALDEDGAHFSSRRAWSRNISRFRVSFP